MTEVVDSHLKAVEDKVDEHGFLTRQRAGRGVEVYENAVAIVHRAWVRVEIKARDCHRSKMETYAGEGPTIEEAVDQLLSKLAEVG